MPLDTLMIAHVNLNCRDLARSRSFFESLGLSAAIRTDPAPQDCRAFGFEGDAQWDAWMMQDERGLGSASLDLLEWKVPEPFGAPAAAGTAAGFERLGFTATDVAEARSAVLRSGGVASEIRNVSLERGAERPAFGARCPDGQALLVSEGSETSLDHVGISCCDLDVSAAFYADVFGMREISAAGPIAVPADVFLPSTSDGRQPARLETRTLQPARADAAGAMFHVVLTRWLDAEPLVAASQEPNRVGLFRMAFLVANIDQAHRELRGRGVAGLSPVTTLDLGPSCPSPPCRALFFRDPDGACLELIEVPALS